MYVLQLEIFLKELKYIWVIVVFLGAGQRESCKYIFTKCFDMDTLFHALFYCVHNTIEAVTVVYILGEYIYKPKRHIPSHFFYYLNVTAMLHVLFKVKHFS